MVFGRGWNSNLRRRLQLLMLGPVFGSGECPGEASGVVKLRDSNGATRYTPERSRLDVVGSDRAPQGDGERWRLSP